MLVRAKGIDRRSTIPLVRAISIEYIHQSVVLYHHTGNKDNHIHNCCLPSTFFVSDTVELESPEELK